MIHSKITGAKGAVFGTAIFPPIQYFAHLLSHQKVFVEAHCHYMRQTYRNRYIILGANGVLPLSVPVEKVSGQKIKTRDVMVSYDTNWHELHWKSIVSAYNASPYFQYYDIYIEELFTRKWKYLLDFNCRSIQTIFDCLETGSQWSLTEDYLPGEVYAEDYRELIHPKRRLLDDTTFVSVPYRQVFGQKHGFTPNLSILDLLFNKGPESLIVLKAAIQESGMQSDV